MTQSPIILLTSFRADPTAEGQNHLLRLTSGEANYIFFFDSALAKKIAKQLSKQVKIFEDANGKEFDDRLDNEPMKSPFAEKE